MNTKMNWRCKVCGEPVTEQDMVGYTHKNGNYVPDSLGFWHNNMKCGATLEGSPRDYPICNFMEIIPQHLYNWIYDGVSPRDVGIMAMRCLIPGYEEAYPHYHDAIQAGVLDPSLPEPALYAKEVADILDWLKKRS